MKGYHGLFHGVNSQECRNANGSDGTMRQQPRSREDAAAKGESLSIKSTPIRAEAGIEAAAGASLVQTLERLSIDVKNTAQPPKLTSVPDLQFQMVDRDQPWDVRNNAFAASVSGVSVSSEAARGVVVALLWRRVLTKRHMVPGYPKEAGAR